MGKRAGILGDRRGAVLAEFAIAFMPICTMFLCVSEMSHYFIARMAIMHAAEVSVRACAVIFDPMPGHDTGEVGKDTDVQQAADMVLKPTSLNPISTWGGFVNKELQYSEPVCKHTDNGQTNGDDDTVTIDATFTCQVPVAQHIICSNGPKTFTMTAKFPHQGADYKL